MIPAVMDVVLYCVGDVKGGALVQPAVLVALIASVTSIVVAVTSAAFAYATQRRMLDAKEKQDAELEQLKHSFSEQSAERSARREYEYEARKRLYLATEPLLFQLSERAEELQAGITGLARTARQGDLEPNAGWLAGDNYYRRHIVYRLVALVALFHLLQDQLTQFDLRLDPRIWVQYSTSKYLAWALTDHYSLAACEPSIPYNPDRDSKNWDGVTEWQGLPSGVLETAGQSLILPGQDGTRRVMRYGEFDEAFSDCDSSLYRTCKPVEHLFVNFHPRDRPVLWRVLIMQALLCAACTAARDRGPTGEHQADSSEIRAWIAIPRELRGGYDWRQPDDSIEEHRVLDEPFEVASQYLERRLGQK